MFGLSADEDTPPETQQLRFHSWVLSIPLLILFLSERRELKVFQKLLAMIPNFEERLMSSSEEDVMAIASMVNRRLDASGSSFLNTPSFSYRRGQLAEDLTIRRA